MSKMTSPEPLRRSYSTHSLPAKFSPNSTSFQSSSQRCTQFRDFLEDQRNEDTLQINKQIIGDRGVSILLDFLREHRAFSSIDFSDCELGPKYFSSICHELKNFETCR